MLGTVQVDLHNIGKYLVGMMLGGTGFELVDLGADVSPEKFVQAVREESTRYSGHVSITHYHYTSHENDH